MLKSEIKEKLENCQVEINCALDPLQEKLILFLNDLCGVEELMSVLVDWRQIRQKFNDQDIGIVVGIKQFGVRAFPLKGDPSLDIGQVNRNHPPKKSGPN